MIRSPSYGRADSANAEDLEAATEFASTVAEAFEAT